MLKRFREESVNPMEEISNEIDRVVDSWVSDLLRGMITSPMNPAAKRSLWDRFKGTLSNLWYGGKYNPKNPYYWKHRFGDELGSTIPVSSPPPLPQQESFDPSIFTLQEYHQLKSVVDTFEETINEQELPAGTEKLQLVQRIKTAAEELKKNLKDIFARGCGGQAPQPVDPAPVAAPIKRGRGRPRKNPAAAAKPVGPVSGLEDPPPAFLRAIDSPASKTAPVLKNYAKWLPKTENQGKTLEYLKDNHQLVDAILHPDYGESDFHSSDSGNTLETSAQHKIRALEKLKKDAVNQGENPSILDKIDEAITKMKKFL